MSTMDQAFLKAQTKKDENDQKENSNESKENHEQREYDPKMALRKREANPEYIYVNENGQEVMEDQDFHYIFKFIRKNVKEGNVLNLGCGITHCHQMVNIADKATHITGLDISEKNNQVTEELLESIKKLEKGKGIDDIDQKTFHILARATAKDESYGIKNSGDEMMKMFYEKCQYKEKPDVLAVDMIADMEKIRSGEIFDGRKYDNVLMIFAFFTQTKKDTLEMVKSVKERLKKGGRLIILDTENYEGLDAEEDEEDDFVMYEDERVQEKYPEPWDWKTEEMIQVLKDAGFNNIKTEASDISQYSGNEQEEFGRYLGFVAEM